MRLWHKDLIPYLAQKQLVAQWRELCCIAKNIADNGTPNHLLVNKILDYPIEHFIVYSRIVESEMHLRGYNVDVSKFDKYGLVPNDKFHGIESDELFKDWHNDRYLIQCYYNLQEKYDCGGLTDDEWNEIDTFVSMKIMKGE